jgi:hypothetical protein
MNEVGFDSLFFATMQHLSIGGELIKCEAIAGFVAPHSR